MARVVADTLAGEVRLTRDGPRARRVFLVTELAGAASQRLALAAQASGLPRVGDAHPVLGGATVAEVAARATDDPAAAFVDVLYDVTASAQSETIAGWQVDLASSFVTEVTTENVSGGRLSTTYRFAQTSQVAVGGGLFQSSTQQFTATRRHRVEVQRPTFALRFTREQATLPLADARRFTGAVNAGQFQGAPADRWLCAVSASGVRPGVQRVTYEFTFSESGWQPDIFYTDDSGLIPDDVTRTNGQASAQVYRREPFSLLRLPRV